MNRYYYPLKPQVEALNGFNSEMIVPIDDHMYDDINMKLDKLMEAITKDREAGKDQWIPDSMNDEVNPTYPSLSESI